MRLFEWLDSLQRDVRLAIRGLRRTPGFTVVAVLSLALGIGANTAVFSVVDAVLLRPLPYPGSERLVRLWQTSKSDAESYGSVSYANYRDWARETSAFSGMTAYTWSNLTLTGTDAPERVSAVSATANLFTVLESRPLLGRTFAPDEDSGRSENVVVISEAFWRRRFGADPTVVGRTITLDANAATIIGVMPAGFSFPAGGGADLLLPLRLTPEQAAARGDNALSVIGRIRPGVELDRAAAELRGVAARLEREHPESQADKSARVVPLRDDVVGGSKRALSVLLGAVALVLLIACANVAGLLLARAASRRQEVAIRNALGAGRASLVRQFLVESLVLALGGAAAGALLAWAALRALAPVLAGAFPVTNAITLDARVLAVLTAVAVLSGIAIGLLPALRGSAPGSAGDVGGALGGRRSTAGSDQQWARRGLVVAELAVSLVLLTGAGLLLRGFFAVSNTPAGFDPANVLTAQITVPAAKYPASTATSRLLRPVLERVRAIPGVRSAAAISLLPIQSAWTWGGYTVEGQPEPAPADAPAAELRLTSPGFFRSLGVPMHAGRDFTEADGSPGAKVVIVNAALARESFGGAAALGQRIRRAGEIYTVVGVVGDVRQAGLDKAPHPEMHFPYGDSTALAAPWVPGHVTLVIKTTVPPTAIVAALRDAVRAVEPSTPLYAVQAMEEVIHDSLAKRRLNLWLLGTFAAVALSLAAIGLYGLIAYLVAQRTREIGVRIALGARPTDVVRLVLRQGAALTVAGVSLGIIGALGLTRLLEGLLYGVSAQDPLTFSALALLLAAVALLATYVPARRAAGVDPSLAMRSE